MSIVRIAIRMAAMVLLGGVLPAGCGDGGGSGGAGKPRVALIMKARTNPFFAKMEEGAKAKADELGAELQVLAIDKETEADKQAAQVETVISQGVDVILIAPADSKAIIAPLLEAQGEGIRIINLDNRINPEEATKAGLNIATFIGPNNEDGAYKSTKALIEKMGGEGEVALLEGIRGVDNAEARKRGFFKAIEESDGKVKVVAQDTAEWAMNPAQEKMEGFLANYPNLGGIFCANDVMALGAVAAIASAGKTADIVVTGYDNIAAAQQAIQDGKMHATIEQHPYRMGALGVENAVKLVKGETISPEIEIETDLILAKDLEAK